MNRKALTAMVHIAKKDLALDDGAYRAVLERVGGASSSKDLDDRQLAAVVDEFRRQGWTPKAGSRGKRSDKPYVRMVWALWSELVAAKAVRARSPRAALRAFVKKHTGVTDPEWLTSDEARGLIEQLKKWRDRVTSEARSVTGSDLCPDCGQPMLPPGERKRPNEYDHASGCPRAPKKRREPQEAAKDGRG